MPDAQYPDRFAGGIEPIQSDVAGRTPGDDQLAPFTLDPPSDQRVMLQDPERLDDRLQRGGCRFRRCLEQEFRQPFEIVDCASRIDYLRHDTGFGRFGFLPAAFARNQDETS